MAIDVPPVPLRAIRPQPMPEPVPTYDLLIAIARDEIGVRELPGEADNPRILQYQSTTTKAARFLRDSVAWCSSFANWCVEHTGLVGTGNPSARSWLTWGEECALEDAWIVVFARPPLPWQGHVAIPVRGGHTDDSVSVIGGNQHNQVSREMRPRAKLLACRRPTLAMLAAAVHS